MTIQVILQQMIPTQKRWPICIRTEYARQAEYLTQQQTDRDTELTNGTCVVLDGFRGGVRNKSIIYLHFSKGREKDTSFIWLIQTFEATLKREAQIL